MGVVRLIWITRCDPVYELLGKKEEWKSCRGVLVTFSINVPSKTTTTNKTKSYRPYINSILHPVTYFPDSEDKKEVDCQGTR